MKRKGINFKRAPHLTFRNPLPGETQTNGRPLRDHHVVIVRVKDCLDADGNFSQSLRAEAPMHGTVEGHSRSNFVYGGPWRKQSRGKWFHVQTKPTLTPAQYKAAEASGEDNPEGWTQQWFDNYWTAPMYWVEDGAVYSATRSTHTNPSA